MSTLDGRVALVTGASRGIGRSLALALAGEGAAVGLLARDESRLAGTAAECDALGVRAHPVAVDVADPAAVRDAVGSVVGELGPLDLLVNAAGAIEPVERPLWEVDPGDWWRVVEVNLRGPALLLHAVLPAMAARGSGRVVNLSSGMGARPVPEYSAYCASKAALMRVTDCVAGPLREHGVAVFDVTPGLVRTDMTAGMPVWANHRDDQFYDVGRVCRLVLAIASGRLDALTGRFLHAGKDEVDTLLAHADAIVAADARTLRLRPYGPDDPTP